MYTTVIKYFNADGTIFAERSSDVQLTPREDGEGTIEALISLTDAVMLNPAMKGAHIEVCHRTADGDVLMNHFPAIGIG